MTFLMRHALAHANPAQLKAIYGALGNNNVKVEQHSNVKLILDSLGSRTYVEQEASSAAAAARQVLDGQQGYWAEPERMFLVELLGYIIRRDQ